MRHRIVPNAVAALLLVLLAEPACADDALLVAESRRGMRVLIDNIALPGGSMPAIDQREELRSIWRSFLDYQMALETVRLRHARFLDAPGGSKGPEFRLYHAAWLAQYRAALDIVARMERHDALHAMLNEPVPAVGLPSGSYASFKLHWLHVARAGEWALFSLLDRTVTTAPLPGAREDAAAILAAGVSHGTAETMQNGARILRGAAWKPVPSSLQAFAGGTPAQAPRPSYISRKQIAAARPLARPGDILFERRDWALTNIGLPGFWAHTSIYVGTPAERRATFGDAFEDALRQTDRRRYDAVLAKGDVVESVGSAGTHVIRFEMSADADYFALMRPRVPDEAKMEAVRRAFAHVGRPYDFDFDFVTDDRIVCSELVYKVYEKAIPFPVMRYARRTVSSPNDFVQWFDEQHGEARRLLELVVFLDGNAARGTAEQKNLAEFRESWKRSRWHAVKTTMREAP